MSQERSPSEPVRGAQRPGIALMRIAGIRIQIDYSWFFIFALILVSLAAGYFPRAHPDLSTASYWTAGVVTSLLFFASILVHELSHALMARASGIDVPAITLFLFGGVSQMSDEPSSPSDEVRIAAVGPLASFALSALFWGLHQAIADSASPLVAGVTLYLAWINAALGTFNLLPGLPLDGGRILRALAWWKTGSLRRGTRVAANAGKGIAVGLMLLGGLEIFAGALVGGLWLVLIGLFLRGTAEAGYQSLVLLQSFQGVTAGDVAIEKPISVPPQLSLAALVEDYFLRYGYRSFPVMEGANVLGIISIEALRDIPEEQRRSASVKGHMQPISDALCVDSSLPLSDAFRRLAAAPGGRLLVMRDGQLEGLLTKQALARFIEIQGVLGASDGSS
jgi:Zn-dependent protease/CBS domain-containing protein